MDSSHSAEIAATHTPALFAEAVKRAAALLRQGEVVALPTETVYGLAANALAPRAVQRIFAIKGRPAHNPIIVHVASLEMARSLVSAWPPIAGRLAKAFWPGPLTLVLPCSSLVPAVVTAGGTTVGLRWPSHPFIQAVIRECEFPLAAPSANPSNEISPTNAQHVAKGLGARLQLIVDGGQSQVGIESTVVDLTHSEPQLLRPGIVHAEAIAAALGRRDLQPAVPGKTLRSPGQLPRHYAPKANLLVWSWASDEGLRKQVRHHRLREAQCCILAHTHIPSVSGFGRVAVIPHDAEAFARALYSELHACDEAGAAWIIVESVPRTTGWEAIADRLRRAAG